MFTLPQLTKPQAHVTIAYSTLTFLLLAFCRNMYRHGIGNVWFRMCCKGPCAQLKFVVLFMFALMLSLMPLGRLMTRYHTLPQVAFGALAGLAIGFLWFLTVVLVLGHKLGPWLEKLLYFASPIDDWNHIERGFFIVEDEFHDQEPETHETFAQITEEDFV